MVLLVRTKHLGVNLITKSKNGFEKTSFRHIFYNLDLAKQALKGVIQMHLRLLG